MQKNREGAIERTMSRFLDDHIRLRGHVAKDGFLPVVGTKKSVEITYTPVTNEEYALYLKLAGAKPPKDWASGGEFQRGRNIILWSIFLTMMRCFIVDG